MQWIICKEGIRLERLFFKKILLCRNELQMALKGKIILTQDTVLSNDASENI
jgi:hypothetical protein